MGSGGRRGKGRLCDSFAMKQVEEVTEDVGLFFSLAGNSGKRSFRERETVFRRRSMYIVCCRERIPYVY